MRQWVIWLTAVALLFAISGCSTEVEGMPIDTESVQPTIEETEPPVILLDNLEYWDIVQDEIVDMLRSHNLYIDIISHAYPCVQFYVEPGIVTEDGKIVASGLTQEEYKEVFESVKTDLHMILDKYKIGKPKTIFHGCNSLLDIFFHNWVIDESKIYDNVYSRDVACYGVDLLEYYYEHEDNSYIKKDAIFSDVWTRYPVYKP
jgi:signal peptidase I